MRHLATISLAALVMALTATACGRDDAVPTAPLAPATAQAAAAQELDPGGIDSAIYAASSFYPEVAGRTVQYGQTTDNTCRVRGRGGASSDFTYTYQDANGNDVDLTVKAGPPYERSSRRFARGPGSRDDIVCCRASPLFRDDLGRPPDVEVDQPRGQRGHSDFEPDAVEISWPSRIDGVDGVHYSRRVSVGRGSGREPSFPGPSCSMGFRLLEGTGPWLFIGECDRIHSTFRKAKISIAVRAYRGRTYGPWEGRSKSRVRPDDGEAPDAGEQPELDGHGSGPLSPTGPWPRDDLALVREA